MITALIILAGVLLVILIIYGVATRKAATVVTSKPVSAQQNQIVADMIYYLPAALVTINVTAKVIVTKNAVQITESASLQSISLENIVSQVPDTSKLICLEYSPNIIMNDELKMTTNASGLLDTVTISSEDRINSILKQVADMGGVFKPADFSLPVPTTMGQTTTIVPYTQTFRLMPDQMEDGKLDCPWMIFTDNSGSAVSKVDAGFTILFKGHKKPQALNVPLTAIPGLYTRPLTTLSFGISPSDKRNELLFSKQTWEITIPDITRLVQVPLQRSAFVKKVSTPKFSYGMLIENYINQPSQFEAFLNMPINIVKAFVSIPAALFNFRIHHEYDSKIAEFTLQKKLADLKKSLTNDKPQNMGRPPGI